MQQNTIYSDLNLSMIPHPLTGDLRPKTNLDSVKQALRVLFFVEKFDFPFDSYRHSSIKKILFEPANQLTESQLKTQLEWFIKKVEPRIILRKIDVEEQTDPFGYNITIWYSIKSIMADDSFTFFVERVR